MRVGQQLAPGSQCRCKACACKKAGWLLQIYSNSEDETHCISSHGAQAYPSRLLLAWSGVNTPSTRHAFADLRDTNAAFCQHAQAAPGGASCTRVLRKITKKKLTHLFLSSLFFITALSTDLLHPSADTTAAQHKLKRLVQAPNSFFMVSFISSFLLLRCALREILGRQTSNGYVDSCKDTTACSGVHLTR